MEYIIAINYLTYDYKTRRLANGIQKKKVSSRTGNISIVYLDTFYIEIDAA